MHFGNSCRQVRPISFGIDELEYCSYCSVFLRLMHSKVVKCAMLSNAGTAGTAWIGLTQLGDNITPVDCPFVSKVVNVTYFYD